MTLANPSDGKMTSHRFLARQPVAKGSPWFCLHQAPASHNLPRHKQKTLAPARPTNTQVFTISEPARLSGRPTRIV